jgi:SSS family solute:Na+ symporter
LMSVALTDGFNGVLMLLGVSAALPLVWSAAGGTEGVLAALPESGRAFSGHYSGFNIASILLPSFLMLVGDANLHQRFLAAPSTAAARRAAWLLIPGVLIVDGLILLSAMAGRALLPELSNPGHVILELALTQLPAMLGALLVASILAIIVSTADSYLLSSSSALVHDIYKRFIRRDASGAQLLKASRLAVGALTMVALVLAFTSDEFFSVALFAYTIYGVGITPPLLAALFWRRATPAGAAASMITATGVAVWWKVTERSAWAAEFLGQPEGSNVDAVVPAIIVAAVALVGVSLLTRPRVLLGEGDLPADVGD